MNSKQAIINALRVFVNQRPGFEWANYGDAASYRSDSRKATKDRDIALQLLRDIELRDSITADAILAEARSGRVQIELVTRTQEPEYTSAGGNYADSQKPFEYAAAKVDYCTGQYFPTEYRAAVARLCASVLWTWKREQCMPDILNPKKAGFNDAIPANAHPRFDSPGAWLRDSFKREYGSHIANRWFS